MAITTSGPNHRKSYPSAYNLKEINLAISTYIKELDIQKIQSFLSFCPELIRPIIITNCNKYVDLFGEKSIIYLIRILISEFYKDYLKVFKKTPEMSDFFDEFYLTSLQSLEYLEEITLKFSAKEEQANASCKVTHDYFQKSLEYDDKIIRSKANFQKYSQFRDLFTLIQTLNRQPSFLRITIGEIARFQAETVPTDFEKVIRKIFENFKFDYTSDRIRRMYRYISLTTKDRADQLFSASARENTLIKLQSLFEKSIKLAHTVTDKYFLTANAPSIEFDDLEFYHAQIRETLHSDEDQLFESFCRFSFHSLYCDLIKKVTLCNHFKLSSAMQRLSFNDCIKNYEIFFYGLPASEEMTFNLLGNPTERDKEILRTSFINPLLNQAKGCNRLFQIGFFNLLKKYIFQFTEASKNNNNNKAAIYFSRFQEANAVLLKTYAFLIKAYQEINIEQIQSQLQDPNVIQALHDLKIYYKYIEKMLVKSMVCIYNFGRPVPLTKKKKKKKKKSLKTSELLKPLKSDIPLDSQPINSEGLKKELSVSPPSETISQPSQLLISKTPTLEKEPSPIKKFKLDEERASFDRVLNLIGSLRCYLKPQKFLELMKKEFQLTLMSSNGKHLKLVDKFGNKIPFPGSSTKDLKIGTAKAIVKEALALRDNVS